MGGGTPLAAANSAEVDAMMTKSPEHSEPQETQEVTVATAADEGRQKRRMGTHQATTPQQYVAEAHLPVAASSAASATQKLRRMGVASLSDNAAKPSNDSASRRRMGTARAAVDANQSTQQVPAPGSKTTSLRPHMATDQPTGEQFVTPTTNASLNQASHASRSGLGAESREASTVTEAAAKPWVKPLVIIFGLLVVATLVVLLARWLRTLEPVEAFLATYSGHTDLPAAAPAGLPGWIGWQHFLNMFFMVLIVRTGLQVRLERRPPGYWKPKKNSVYSPRGATPKKVSLSQWLHQSLDILWLANGVVFIVLLFATGQWMRIVPLSWDIFPHMASSALQYASLDWPLENGWVHYNALQVMAYFVTVFIAAPLAVISGIRISTWWPDTNKTLNRLYPVGVARAIHLPVMVYFVIFTVVHVLLVFLTGALRNLNHMYTSRDVVDVWGLGIFLLSVGVIAAGWILTKAIFITPIAAKTGQVSK